MENEKVGLPTWLQRRLLTALRPGDTLQARNIRHLYSEVAWYGVLYGVITSFVSVYLLRLGGTDTQVGLLSSLPALVIMLVSIPGGRLVEQERRPLSVLMITAILHRAGYLAMGILPFIAFVPQAWGVVLLTGLLTIPQAVANVAFTAMFAHVVPPDKRAHVVAIRNVWVGIVSTATALAGGYFLETLAFPLNYQLLLIAAFVLSMIGAHSLAQIRLPEPATAPPVQPVRPPAVESGVRGFLRMLHTSPGFTPFAIVSFVSQWGLFFCVPLYSIFWVRTLHASDAWVGLYGMVQSATTIVSYPLWGRLTTRRGNRMAMIITMAGLAGFPFFLAFCPSVEWVLLVALWGGIFSSGQALSFYNGLLELCPSDNRAARIAAYNTVVNLAAFAAPLVSAVLVDAVGIQQMLLLGGAMRLAGAVLIRQMRGPEKKTALS